MNTTMTQCETNDVQSQEAELTKQTIRPSADVYETENAWFLVLEMPGVDENGAEVSIEKRVLTVSGDVDPFDTEGFEQQFGQFAARRYERSFRLPEDIDTTAIEAHVKSGVLRLRLPKAATALPHKVTVKAG